MADDEWKQDIRKNWTVIIKNLANPDELLEYLHHNITPPLLNEEQMRKIKSMTSKKEKTRKLMSTLMYGDDRVLPAFVQALRATKNEALADKLGQCENKLTQERRKKLHLGPKVWPPSIDELEQMHEANAELCDMADVLRGEYTHQEEVYTMTAERRGLAVIINNTKFKDPTKDRIGSDEDRDKLSRVLCQLHFDIRIYNNVTGADILRIAEESSHWGHHQESDCFIFVVLSHGSSEGVHGTDNGIAHIDKIVANFNSINCPHLTGKPKVFLFQACRITKGTKDEKNQSGTQEFDSMEPSSEPEASNEADYDDDDVDTDIGKAFEKYDQVQEDSSMDEEPGKQIPRSHVSSDFFFAYATPEGFRAYRQEKRGSWFIQAIVWVLKYNAHKDHLLNLITKVNNYVSTAMYGRHKGVQVSEMRGTPQKRLYFFPGIYNDPPEKNDYTGKCINY